MKTLGNMLLKNKTKAGLILFIALVVMPFAAGFIYALLHSFGLIGILNKEFTFNYWSTILIEGRFLSSLAYSTLIACVAVILSLMLSIGSVLAFNNVFRKPVINFLLYLPLAIPGIVTAFFTYQVFSKTGFLSRILFKIGLIAEASHFPDMVNDEFAIGIIVTFVSLLSPFFTLYYMTIYHNENLKGLEQLSKTLGANKWTTISRISIPILIKKSWILIVLYFIFLLGAYEVPLVLGQESPQMLSVLILEELKQFDLDKISNGYAMASLYTILVGSIVFLLFSRKTANLDV